MSAKLYYHTKGIEEISYLLDTAGDNLNVFSVGPVLLGLFLKGVFGRHDF